MNEDAQVECPFCAEKIKARAKKCKHCGEWKNITDAANTADVEKDNEEWIDGFLMAAEQGNVNAQFHLGTLYQGGRSGIRKDNKEAAHWLLKAAEQGHTEAQKCLGMLDASEKGRLFALFLGLGGGFISGAHLFYVGKYRLALAMIVLTALTVGLATQNGQGWFLLLIFPWWLFDCYRIAVGKFPDHEGKILKKWWGDMEE